VRNARCNHRDGIGQGPRDHLSDSIPATLFELKRPLRPGRGVQAKSVADEARKSAASAALYIALALLIGAFVARGSAAMGGRLRDEYL
jgi:hypothetical protein